MIETPPLGSQAWDGRLAVWIRGAGITALSLGAVRIVPHAAALLVGYVVLALPRLSGTGRWNRVASGAALVAAAAGTTAASLRWETFDLDVIAGAQGVLGPSISVGPAEAAAASVLGVAAVILALAATFRVRIPEDRRLLALLAAEFLAAGLGVALLAWGPMGKAGELWLAATIVAISIAGLSVLSSKTPRRVTLALLGLGVLSAGIAFLMLWMAA